MILTGCSDLCSSVPLSLDLSCIICEMANLSFGDLSFIKEYYGCWGWSIFPSTWEAVPFECELSLNCHKWNWDSLITSLFYFITFNLSFMLAKVFKMLSQGNHQVNEKILQNSQHFVLCWQGYSLEKLWLLGCCERREMKRGWKCSLWPCEGQQEKGEDTSKWETKKVRVPWGTRGWTQRGLQAVLWGSEEEEYMTGARC